MKKEGKGNLGHSWLSITMDLYAHVLSDEKTKEMQKISETPDFTAKNDHPRKENFRG